MKSLNQYKSELLTEPQSGRLPRKAKRSSLAKGVVVGILMCGAVGVVGASAAQAAPIPQPLAATSSAVKASKATHIVWNDKLDSDLTFEVSNVDNYDWDGVSRPDHAFPEGINGYTLHKGTSADERLEINRTFLGSVNAHFNVTATDATGKVVFSKRLSYEPSFELSNYAWLWDVSDGHEKTASIPFNYHDAQGNLHSATAKPTLSMEQTEIVFSNATQTS